MASSHIPGPRGDRSVTSTRGTRDGRGAPGSTETPRPSLGQWGERWLASTSRAKDRLGDDTEALGQLRPVIRDSWLRSLGRVDPMRSEPRSVLGRSDLVDYRNAHPLAPVLPVVHRLLLRYTLDQGLIVALGDDAGRLLWVDGDDQAMRKADAMGFIEGADWSEESMGTSAPGTALWLRQAVQVRAIEHFSHIVEPWSCSAIPIRDPHSDKVLGVLDITGGDDAIAPATIPLLEATVAAMEAQLELHGPEHSRRLEQWSPPEGDQPHDSVTPKSKSITPRRRARSQPAIAPVLRVLGRDLAVIERPGHPELTLGQKHSEILTLLTLHPHGLSATALSELVYGPGRPNTTIRAEVSRLKTVLHRAGLGLRIDSRPYRLHGQLDTDIARVRGFLGRGAHRVALAKYVGPVLPESLAPGIETLRRETHLHLREALMQDASVDVLLDYANLGEVRLDLEVWRACLGLLPAKSPRRTEVMLHIEALESECNDMQPSTN